MRIRLMVLEREGQLFVVRGATLMPGGIVSCHAMNETKTLSLQLNMDEWNKLPFHWFEDAGLAEPIPDRFIPRG